MSSFAWMFQKGERPRWGTAGRYRGRATSVSGNRRATPGGAKDQITERAGHPINRHSHHSS